MLVLKYGLLTLAAAMFATVAGILLYDIYLAVQHRRRVLAGAVETGPVQPIRWRLARKIALLATLPVLAGLSIVVVPAGMAGVRVSQISGTRPGTLYPGVHLLKPLIDQVVIYDTRDKIFSTAVADENKKEKPVKPLTVQSKEGLTIGLAVTVRYRLDARRLDYIHSNLPQPVDIELVPPVVASAFRDLAPNYTVRDIFSARRDEVRQ